MKEITINGKNYKLEYSIEASLYDECIEKVINLMQSFTENPDEGLSNIINSISNLPKVAITVFYAGLLENHSDEVRSLEDAKSLVKQYMKENADTNFYNILTTLLECMGDDGFFKLIGLEQMSQEAEKAKVPQDHKRKLKKS